MLRVFVHICRISESGIVHRCSIRVRRRGACRRRPQHQQQQPSGPSLLTSLLLLLCRLPRTKQCYFSNGRRSGRRGRPRQTDTLSRLTQSHSPTTYLRYLYRTNHHTTTKVVQLYYVDSTVHSTQLVALASDLQTKNTPVA